MDESTYRIVKINRRLGAGEEPTGGDLSFRIRDGFDPTELVEMGLTVDGDEAVWSVGWYPLNGEFGLFGTPRSLSSLPILVRTPELALARAEEALVTYLRECGFEPQYT